MNITYGHDLGGSYVIDQTMITNTTSTSPYNYGTSTITIAPNTYSGTTLIGNYGNQKSLKVNGDAEFDGDITIKGKSLNKTLEKIEEKLAILHPNTELEEKWVELRNLRKMYMDLEKEIIEKEKMWAILKR